MANGHQLTFGDIDELEFKRIRSLSNSIQEHFKKESSTSSEAFQIHANQRELDSFFNTESTNSNNNIGQSDETTHNIEVRSSFQSIPSDSEELNLLGLDPDEDHVDRSKSGKRVTRQLKQMIKKRGVEESPKPQRVIKKATKKHSTTPAKKSRSMFEYFNTYAQSNLEVDLVDQPDKFNDAILLSPSQGTTFEFAAPQSVISLPDFNSKQTPTTRKDNSTSIGSSLNSNTPSNSARFSRFNDSGHIQTNKCTSKGHTTGVLGSLSGCNEENQ